MDGKTGIIREGYQADVTVLNEDIFTIAPEQIKNVKVLRTIMKGREVFLSKD